MGILTVCFSNILACILCWILVVGILMVPPMFFATQSTGKFEDFSDLSDGTKALQKNVFSPCQTGWWFQIFFIFTPIWGNDPI